MKISFHGATGEVTGSSYLIRSNKQNILIDCGLYQNGAAICPKNEGPLKFGQVKPSEIDEVILTHAHVDHDGRLPLLYKQGFRGRVLCTEPTAQLADLTMSDCAFLMGESARRKEKEPIYTQDDVDGVLDRFRDIVKYNQTVDLGEGIKVTLFDSGHILGAASVLVELTEGPSYKRIVFSGDIGNNNKPIVKDPTYPDSADFVIEESTYGNRLHKPITDSTVEFYSAINETFKRGGNVFIPILALERTQEILFFLREGLEKELIPMGTKVFLDSPMAIKATQIFRQHPSFYNDKTREVLERGIDPFSIPNLTFSQTADDSRAINDIKGGSIIMAGSGMCNGGRIIHHLKHNLSRPECSFVFVSYATPGSLARRIIDGSLAKRTETPQYVSIFGNDVPVKAKIHTINGFSAHADQNELLEWARHTGSPKKLFLTHGCKSAIEVLEEKLIDRRFDVVVPELHEEFKF